MRRVQIDEVTPGMRLARTLYYQYGGIMLAAGATLDPRAIGKLREFGYLSLYIHDSDLEDVIAYDYIDEQARQKITRHVSSLYESLKEETKKAGDAQELATKSAEEFKSRAQDKRFRKILDRANLQETFLGDVEKIMESILSDQEMSLCVGTIKTVHSFLYEHSFEVAIHSAILAKHFGFPRLEIRDIVLGSLLHDIGQIFLPEDLLTKKSPFTPKEEEIFRQHTVLGYHLLKDRNDISLLCAHIAYQHHEHQDGTGYPRGITGQNRLLSKQEALRSSGGIHRFAEIVAVPDFYDELVSERPYRKALGPDEAALAVKEAGGSALNREVVDAFLSYLPVFPIGTAVAVTSGKYVGWTGVVVGVDREDLSKPRIRLLFEGGQRVKNPVNIDLRKDDEITVKAVWK